jgi:hypothetical protein
MKNFNFFGGNEVKNEVANIRRGERGMNVVAVVSCDKKLDKTHKDMVGRIFKVCMWNDRPLVSYSGNVNAKSDIKFESKPRKGFTWTEYPYFEVGNKSQIEYLTFSYRDCDKGDYSEYYLIDDDVVTSAAAKAYFKEEKYYAPKTQIAVGVTKDEEFSKVVRYELEKVLYVGTSKTKAIEEFNKYKE